VKETIAMIADHEGYKGWGFDHENWDGTDE
jgi:hypothetical protein